MTESVTDAAARRQALDASRSFIVQAPAGSGKTELLTQRYLRLLSLVNHPEEIYAITFTRKAAAEMRQRIIAALQIAGQQQPAETHRRLTWSLARDAAARDAQLGWQLHLNPNRLRIQTFDSLSHALARQMPVTSELGAPPATTERPERHYQQAARATLRQIDAPGIGQDIATLLMHLDNRQGQLEALICAMLSRRDQWLAHTLSAPDPGALQAALEEAVTDQLGQLLAITPTPWMDQLCDAAAAAAHALQQLNGDPGPLRIWLDREDRPGRSWQDLPAWRALANLLLTKDGRPRQKWTKKEGFPAPSERGLSDEQKATRLADKARIEMLAAAVADDDDRRAAWHGLRMLPATGLSDDQLAVLQSLFQVLLRAALELKLVFAETAEVDFAEIQMRAQTALGEPERPTNLALALDYRLQHLLVDEFQDTSSSQYRLLETLTAGWQSGDGRTLFAVGDPMQSIYRFREAEVGLFLKARAQGIGNLPLTPLTLEVNFRSTRGIVDWVNRAFIEILPRTVDPARGAVPYTAATAFDGRADAQAVEIHPFAGTDYAAEAELVCALVGKALRETPDGQIAVLARARTHLAEIAIALDARGLHFQAVDIHPLSQQAVVRDLYALTRALLHPGDRLAWLTLLRTPWIGLDMPDITRIAEHTGRTVFARLSDPAVIATLSEDGRNRVRRLLAVIRGQLPARGRRPLRQWIERQWHLLGGRAAAGTRETDAQAFLALLDEHGDAEGVLDFTLLDTAIERLYAAPDSRADGRIQLMTMHKAKGLEFDTVILPGLGRPSRSPDAELLYWLERPSRHGGARLLMAPIRSTDTESEPISNYLRQLNKDKDDLESARLLYVAATRARRRLHLLGHLSVAEKGLVERPAANSLLARLWCVVAPAFAELAPPPTAASTTAVARLSDLRRLPADWQPDGAVSVGEASDLADTGPERIEFSWASDTARHIGTLVHRQLERIAEDGIEHWPAARVTQLERPLRLGLRHLGVPAGELDQAVAKCSRALCNMLSDETGRWILDRHEAARSEWPLSHRAEDTRHYVIDRTFIDESGTRWIIDYKTGDHLDGDRDAFLDREQTRYREQLETYGRILSELEDRPIRLALYFPLFADWRVWSYAPA